jgi:hypothetical protein
MAVMLSPLRAGHALSAGRFLVLISGRGWFVLRAIVHLEGLGKFKKSNDLNGNRTRELTACSIAPQPTTLTPIALRVQMCIPLEDGPEMASITLE